MNVKQVKVNVFPVSLILLFQKMVGHVSPPHVNFKNISQNLEGVKNVGIINKLMKIEEGALVKNVLTKAM